MSKSMPESISRTQSPRCSTPTVIVSVTPELFNKILLHELMPDHLHQR